MYTKQRVVNPHWLQRVQLFSHTNSQYAGTKKKKINAIDRPKRK